jgi:hypothetical protein
MGINFIDTIVVRRSLNKGTSSTSEPASPAEFMGNQNKENTENRMKLAGDLWIMSAKGTSRIKLSDMEKSKTADIKGHYISTGKGTGRIRI